MFVRLHLLHLSSVRVMLIEVLRVINAFNWLLAWHRVRTWEGWALVKHSLVLLNGHVITICAIVVILSVIVSLAVIFRVGLAIFV